MSEYPEHDKISGLNGSNQTAGEFLDWIREEKGLRLCEWVPEGDNPYDDPEHWQSTGQSTLSLLYEFFDIDSAKLEEEKVAMLQQCRDAHEAKDAEA